MLEQGGMPLAKAETSALTRKQVRDLANYRPTPYLVTSLYLEMDRTSSGGGRTATLRRLIRDARAGLDQRQLTRKQKRSVEEDLGALERVARDARTRSCRAVCVFVASGAGYEQVFDLQYPVKSRLVLDVTPAVRPLAALLREQPRYLVALADRTRARLLAVHFGQAVELGEFDSEVPAQVKEGGHRGYAEKGIDRHIDDHVMRHLKRVAEQVRETFGEDDYDWLVLGGPSEIVTRLKEHLNPALAPRLAGSIPAPLTAAPDEVAGLCRTHMAGVLARRDEELVERLVEGVESTGMGVAGAAATLGALRRGAVASLILGEDYEEPGVECRACGFLGPLAEMFDTCPVCGGHAMHKVRDLGREMMDRAAESGAAVFHVGTEPAAGRLRAMRGVGALLRFRLV